MQTISDRINIIIDTECGGKAIDFAERLGLRSSSVSMWRSGSSTPSTRTIQQISDTFGYNRDWIATGEGDPRSLAPVEKQVIEYLSHAIKYRSSSVDRFIRAVAQAAAHNPEALDPAIDFLESLVSEYRAQSPPEE